VLLCLFGIGHDGLAVKRNMARAGNIVVQRARPGIEIHALTSQSYIVAVQGEEGKKVDKGLTSIKDAEHTS
jgi:hypothetical protein